MPHPLEVLVVGGGPAGCAAARLLALWGHDVTLVTAPPSSPHTLPESIPPSCGRLFDAIGVREAVDGAGFLRSTGHTAWWEHNERVEWFADGERGWQVTSRDLEPVLRRAVLDAGVRLESHRLTCERALRHDAAFILDCTGRAGMAARANGWRLNADRRTVALVGLWHAVDESTLSDRTHTLIESYGNGWAWSVPATAGSRFIAVMVDPELSSLERGVSPERVYRAEVEKTSHFARMVAPATLVEGPFGWDATTYHSRQLHDDRLLLVGDAATFVDPLSSAGVQKALASGWLAAIAVHTCLVHPERRATALQFFVDREVEVFDALSTQARAFLSSAASMHPQPFWAGRAFDGTADRDAQPDPRLIDRDLVREALEGLRRAPAVRLRVSPSVRIEPRPAIAGSEIVLEPRIVAGADARGVRYLHDVDLVTLLEMAPTVDQVPDLYEAYQRRSGPVPLPEFLTALSTMIAQRWLCVQ